MNRDLEKQLDEMGGDYHAVVNRLRAAQERALSREIIFPSRQSRFWNRRAPYLLVASVILVLALAFSSLLPPPSSLPTHPSYGAREYHLTVDEIVATQHPDGGWQNDFLTRRNAELLAHCENQAARIAYKKAIRNLRAKGIL